jgi:hypothetical protein
VVLGPVCHLLGHYHRHPGCWPARQGSRHRCAMSTSGHPPMKRRPVGRGAAWLRRRLAGLRVTWRPVPAVRHPGGPSCPADGGQRSPDLWWAGWHHRLERLHPRRRGTRRYSVGVPRSEPRGAIQGWCPQHLAAARSAATEAFSLSRNARTFSGESNRRPSRVMQTSSSVGGGACSNASAISRKVRTNCAATPSWYRRLPQGGLWAVAVQHCDKVRTRLTVQFHWPWPTYEPA